MKSTGVIRKLDELGRIVIPIEQRRALDINLRDPVEINIEDNKIVIRKYHTSCVFCGSAKGVTTFKDKLICKKCLGELRSADPV